MRRDTTALIRKAGACLSSGKRDLAGEYCRKAIATNPGSIEHWWELGSLAAQLACFPETERCCREVIARNPSIPEAHLYLGIALQRQARLAEAESVLEGVLRQANGFAAAHYYLGIVQQSLNKTDEALASYSTALRMGHEPASTRYNISLLQMKLGRADAALESGFAALKAQPDNLKYRQNFVKALHAACPCHADGDMRAEIIRCFGVRGIDSASLMKPGLVLLAQDRAVNHLLQLARAGQGGHLREQIIAGAFREVFGNRLFERLLMHTKFASEQFEVLLTILRRTALDWLVDRTAGVPEGLFDTDGRFAVALACQFFNTDHAAYATAEELRRADTLAGDFGPRPQDGSAAAGVVSKVAVLCMYQPLHTRAWAGSLAATLRSGPAGDVLHPLLKAQWSDPVEERRIRDNIRPLTPVRNEVSRAVSEQYEDSPYPRWCSATLFTPVPFREDVTVRFPCRLPPGDGSSGPDILIAGCGTGRHAVMSATHYKDARVLAVDLSRTSLAYAIRSTQELDVGNIEYAQADILELGSLERRFHLIETVGVLHHMQRPEAGLEVLCGLLREGGLIRIGLYSRRARRDVVAARAFIAERGWSANAADIRRARQALMALEAGQPARRVTRFRDFYTLSECRDLLFHVHECQFDPAGIAALLESLGLEFLGFLTTDPQIPARYGARYPDDPAQTSLQNWEEFETAHPDAFAEMYDFMCQKT